MKRQILSILLTLCFLVNLVPYVTPTVSAASYSGECGDNLTWTFDTDTGVLRISGTGPMADSRFNPYTNSYYSPWDDYCSEIRSVEIDSGVTSIGVHAFSNCNGLLSVTIGPSVTSIGEYAFIGRIGLTGVTIPASVISIAPSAFRACSALQAFDVDEANPYYTDGVDGALYNKDHTTLIICPGGHSGNYIVADSVISIGDFAFSDCTGLTSVTIPDSVTSIGEWAFSYCTGLTSVTIPDSVTSIGEWAFHDCTGLTSVTIGNSVTSIGSCAFWGCEGLTSVTIPDSVVSIGHSAFNRCSVLTSVTIPDSVTSIDSEAFYNTGYYQDQNNWENHVLYIGNHLIEANSSINGEYRIRDNTVTIANRAFYGCTGLTSVTIGNSVTSIGEMAFYDCTGLTSVIIPDNVTSIGDNAFFNCDGLTSVIIGNGVTSIGDKAFSSCSGLTSVTIGNSVVSIGANAFEWCKGLTNVTIPNSVTSIDVHAFSCCSGLTSVTIGNSVVSIGDYAFYCSGLTSVTIPDSVASIGFCAFNGCTKLTTVTIPSSVTSIGGWAFNNCRELTDVYYTGAKEMWNEIAIADGNDPLHNATIHFNDASQPEVRDIQIRHTLDLASDISITFAVSKADLADYDSYYLECVLPEYEGNEQVGSSTVKIDPVISGNYYYFTLTGITAIRMGDMVDAVLHMTKDGVEYISKTDSYSVATYAYAMMSKTTDSKMLTLCADLLRYGAEAQSFKGYRTDALVNSAMTDAQKAYLSDTNALTFTATDSFLGDLENTTITWVGKTLDLGSKVGMKFVFNAKNYSGNGEVLSMKVRYQGNNGATKTVTLTGAEVYNAANSYYSFTFYGLLAAELRTIVDVAIFDGETQLSETLRYSAESYAAKTAGTALEPLTRALFAYSGSAKAVFTPQPVTYTVTFMDWDGTVLKTETVESGKSATAPAEPARSGYVFAGWDTEFDSVTANLVVTAQYTLASTDPALVLSNATASAGETNVVITVSVKNNPGILGAVFAISYDSSALTLTGATNNVTASGVSYTSPSKYKNPTVFVWDAQDLTWTEDGTILTLTFDVSNTAANGSYSVNLDYDPYDIFDANGDPIDFVVTNAVIEVR